MFSLYKNLVPGWLNGLDIPSRFLSEEDMVRFSISLAARNVIEHTGGPFGAALFDEEGCVISVGVNRVVPLKNAFYHAEFVCISGAFERLGNHCLPADQIFTLAVSAQPCSMCTGAIVWAGVKNLLVGASRDLIESITGFDEGPLHPDWKQEFEARGITVRDGLLVEEACEVFRSYISGGGNIYNPA